MISLQHQWIFRRLRKFKSRARWPFRFRLILDEEIVVKDPDEFRIADFLSAGVEARGLKPDVERLPISGPAAGID